MSYQVVKTILFSNSTPFLCIFMKPPNSLIIFTQQCQHHVFALVASPFCFPRQKLKVQSKGCQLSLLVPPLCILYWSVSVHKTTSFLSVYCQTWSKAVPPGPEGVKVVVGRLGEVVVVLPHRGDGRDQADVVPLLHPVARWRLVVRECVAVITCNDVVQLFVCTNLIVLTHQFYETHSLSQCRSPSSLPKPCHQT